MSQLISTHSQVDSHGWPVCGKVHHTPSRPMWTSSIFLSSLLMANAMPLTCWESAEMWTQAEMTAMVEHDEQFVEIKTIQNRIKP